MYDKEETTTKEPTCPRCGLRSLQEECQNCGTPIILDKKDKEEDEEEYDNWREKKR